jgi:hypothetical protein
MHQKNNLLAQYFGVALFCMALAGTVHTPKAGAVEPFATVKIIDDPFPALGSSFGSDVDISGDRVIVGDDEDDTFAANAGIAHIYNANTGALVNTIAPLWYQGPNFASAVSLSGDVAAILGAGKAHLYNIVSGDLLRTLGVPGASFTSVSSDGDLVLLGAYDFESTGRAYLFDAGTGQLLHTIINPEGPEGRWEGGFGWEVSVSGNNLLIGDLWWSDESVPDNQAILSGRAYIFDATTGALRHTIDNPAQGNRKHFGIAVSISGDRALIGTSRYNDAGQAYIFDAASGQLMRALQNPDSAIKDRFGTQVALTDKWAIVRANYYDAATYNDYQYVTVFDAATGMHMKTIHSDDLRDIRYGQALAATDEHIVIGAERAYTEFAAQSGRVWLYDNRQQISISVEPAFSKVHPLHDGLRNAAGLNDAVPVSVYGTSVLSGDAEDFSVSDIDPSTIRFGPAKAAVDPASSPVFDEDADNDGNPDGRLEFLTGDTEFGCTDTEAELTGKNYSGDAFVGIGDIEAECNAQCHD